MAVKREAVSPDAFESRDRLVRDILSHLRGMVDRAYEDLASIEELAEIDVTYAIIRLRRLADRLGWEID